MTIMEASQVTKISFSWRSIRICGVSYLTFNLLQILSKSAFERFYLFGASFYLKRIILRTLVNVEIINFSYIYKGKN